MNDNLEYNLTDTNQSSFDFEESQNNSVQKTTVETIKERIIEAFFDEFCFLKDKFEIIDLLENCSPMDYDVINYLKLPSAEYNIVWHPGVYVFIGNNSVYRVGRSVGNARARVMEHLYHGTATDDFGVWDINNYDDKSILLFNVKDKNDWHWILALEAYFEEKFTPLIRAKRK